MCLLSTGITDFPADEGSQSLTHTHQFPLKSLPLPPGVITSPPRAKAAQETAIMLARVGCGPLNAHLMQAAWMVAGHDAGQWATDGAPLSKS